MPKHHSFGPPTHRPHTQAETRTSLPYNHAQRAHVKEMYVCMWWRACVYNSEHKHVDVGPDVLVDFLWGLLHWMVWLPARQVAHASPLHSITGTIAIANPLRVSLTLASSVFRFSQRPGHWPTDRPLAVCENNSPKRGADRMHVSTCVHIVHLRGSSGLNELRHEFVRTFLGAARRQRLFPLQPPLRWPHRLRQRRR